MQIFLENAAELLTVESI